MQLGEIYEVFAKQIYQSDMYGFIEVEEYIFNQNKQLVVDPSSEKLEKEFKSRTDGLQSDLRSWH